MLEAEKIDDDQPELTNARFRTVAGAWAVTWSLLVALLLFTSSSFTGAAEQTVGRTSGISVTDRMHLLSLASRDGQRQTLSADRKSGPHSRLDPPAALEAFTALVRCGDAPAAQLPHLAAHSRAGHPAAYDCRGPPVSTT